MLKPPRLRPGDCVGVVSPSSAITPDLEPQLQQGISTLEKLGLRVKLGDHARDRYFYNAGTVADRVREFHRMWADPEVSAVIMSQGGQTANHLLPHLDFELFRAKPKIFVGISDGTTLLNSISTRSELVTFHGQDLLWGFGRTMTDPFIENVENVLMRGWSGIIPSTTFRTIREGHASGRLCGGHLNILLYTTFAGYGPNFDGAILIVEGTSPVDELDCQINALRLNGVFDRISGLVLGHFDNHELSDPNAHRDVADMVVEATSDYAFPIVELNEIGHNVENFLIPFGVSATINTAEKSFQLDEPAVI